MNFINNITDKILKTRFCGIYIHENGFFEVIELEEKESSHVPIFFRNDSMDNFIDGDIFKKKRFIKKFKEIKKLIKSDNVFLNSFKNKKLEEGVTSALKISGFTEVKIIKNTNIEGIILDKNSKFRETTIYFKENNITFYTTFEEKIINEKNILSSDFSVNIIENYVEKFNIDHIFLAGITEKNFNLISPLIYYGGAKSHLRNIWINFLSFSDEIPQIFPYDSQIFIEVLSITVPKLKKWKYDIKNDKNKKSPSDNKIRKPLNSNTLLETPKKLYLPKKRKKFFLPRNNKNGMWKKIKEVLNSEI